MSLARYSLASGVLATVMGAAASLLVAGTAAKVAAWIGTSAGMSVAAGLIYRLTPDRASIQRTR